MSPDLKAYRSIHGLSQPQLAAILGISKSTVSMVENGERSLPAAAAKKMAALQHEELMPAEHSAFYIGQSLHNLKDSHMRQSEAYLLSYKKDCQGALHKYEKQVRGWTGEYNKAAFNLLMADHYMVMIAKGDMPAKFVAAKKKERMAAEEALTRISRQKPEIVMAKIAGLKQEIRAVKAMLGKQRKHLGMQDTILNAATGNRAMEQAGDVGELPAPVSEPLLPKPGF